MSGTKTAKKNKSPPVLSKDFLKIMSLFQENEIEPSVALEIIKNECGYETIQELEKQQLAKKFEKALQI